jgi:SAM-dependent methyltransferase
MHLSDESEKLDNIAKGTWNDSYKLSQMPNLWGDNSVPFITKAIETFSKNSANKIIDFPCGDGRNLIKLVNVFPLVVGADSSLNALQITKEVVNLKKSRNCILVESDIFNSGFLEGQFDGVFCWDLLGHLRNAENAIKELIKLCAEDGIIIGSVFALGDSTRGQDMRSIGNEEYIYMDKFYFKYYDENEVRSLLKNFSAEVISIELAVWEEPPHEGYREYPHEHQSWVFTLRK